MARAPNEKVEKAYQMFKDGMKLVEIANQLNVPDGTVRRWKSTYKWDDEQSERSEKKIKNKSERSVKKKKAVSKEVKQVLENPDLTDKQRLFCLYYNKSFNATQSYAKAYGCDYVIACTNASRLLENAKVKQEIMRLKESKLQRLFAAEDDFVDLHMRIAFADMGNYVSFGLKEKPIVVDGIPLTDEEGKPMTYKTNTVDLEDSNTVDTQLIKAVKEGKNGISIELLDRCKSMDWLDRYFQLNPLDRHKIDYDNKKLELEKLKANTDNNDKTINIIHNIPRPKKGGEE